MNYFNLPTTTVVQKVIPKNAFDAYTNSKQKRLFKDQVARITWVNKLSKETVNLDSEEIKELQVFKIDLKLKTDISSILDVIDKAIPYHIIFVMSYEDNICISTSPKHAHPINEDNSVIDWSFKTEWMLSSEIQYNLNLKKSIDNIYKDFCYQLAGKKNAANLTLDFLVSNQQQIQTLKKEISSLQSQISKCKQFNRKVELNIVLKQKEKELLTIKESF